MKYNWFKKNRTGLRKVGSSTQKAQKYGHLMLKPIEKLDVWFERWFKKYKKANKSKRKNDEEFTNG